MYPEEELGQKFWKRVYGEVQSLYGTTEIPINTFNKVWIIPEKAVVYEHGNTVFILESRLRVMLEEDYVALQNNLENAKYGSDQLKQADQEAVSGISSEVTRDVLIPEIEREVNEGETFANLRQVYHSMILAAWYKQNLKESLLGQVYIDQQKTKGVDVEDAEVNQKIYEQYLEVFEKGVYNYIKEDYDSRTETVIPRKYFSGGATMAVDSLLVTLSEDNPRLTARQKRAIQDVIRKYGTGNLDQTLDKLRVALYEFSRDNKGEEKYSRQIAKEVEDLSADGARQLFGKSPILEFDNVKSISDGGMLKLVETL
jgi:hypothetical protein